MNSPGQQIARGSLESHNSNMQEQLLPLFPLNTVLFPGTTLPLHIFEDRYQEMIGEVMEGGSEFGVVLAREQGIANVGCTATVEKVVRRYRDGRMDIDTVGRRRFEVLLLNDEKSYLRAPVEFFEDEESEPAPTEIRQKAMGAWSALRNLDDTSAGAEPSVGDPHLSFQVAQLIADLNFRQTMLNMRSEPERLKLLIKFLAQYIPKQSYVMRMKGTAPRNGHGRHPSGLEGG